MWFTRLLGRNGKSARRQSARNRRPAAARLALEYLECRLAPALFTVTSAADSGPNTLRDAITQANSAPGADTINFDFGTTPTTINLVSNLPTITGPLTLTGAGQDITLVATNQNNVLQTSNASDTTIRDLRIRGYNDTAINVNGGSNVTIERVHAGNITAPYSGGTGTRTNNVSGLTIRDVLAYNKTYGIEVSGGSDVRIVNPDVAYTQYGIRVSGVGQSSPSVRPLQITGGVYTGVTQRTLWLENITGGLTVSDGTAPNSDVVIADGALATSRGDNDGVLYFNNVQGGLTIDNVDVSWAGADRPGWASACTTRT